MLQRNELIKVIMINGDCTVLVGLNVLKVPVVKSGLLAQIVAVVLILNVHERQIIIILKGKLDEVLFLAYKVVYILVLELVSSLCLLNLSKYLRI